MKQILHLFNCGDLIKIGEEIYLVISHDKIYHDYTIERLSVTWWTTLLDMKGNFFEIDSELLSRSGVSMLSGEGDE